MIFLIMKVMGNIIHILISGYFRLIVTKAGNLYAKFKDPFRLFFITSLVHI